jgi:hypothetical protein
MGLTIDSLKRMFPRSAQALEKYDMLVDEIVMTTAERQRLKGSVRMLTLVMAEEIMALGDRAKTLGSLIGMFRRK